MATDPDVAVVTGGAGAIGAAVCRRLAASGLRVAVVDLDDGAAARVADELKVTAIAASGSTWPPPTPSPQR